jgi:hypothetical protein
METSALVQSQRLVLDFSEDLPNLPPEEAVINVLVDPAFLTPAIQDRLSAMDEEGSAEDMDAFIEMITGLVLEWDLTEKGVVIPLEREPLRNTSIIVLGKVLSSVSRQLAEQIKAEGKA